MHQNYNSFLHNKVVIVSDVHLRSNLKQRQREMCVIVGFQTEAAADYHVNHCASD